MSILRTKNITKIYPGTKALDNITSNYESGKIHAICGKNGSGKSTLIKVFSGAIRPTEGKIYLDDNELIFNSPQDAIDKKIATVYQELSLFPSLTVAENIFIGRMPMKGFLIDWKKANEDTKNLLNELEVDLEPGMLVSDLTMWQCQMLEIVKAMSTEPKVLMLDEPTSSLAQNETEILFKMIKKLKERDVIILYISHRLQELWDIADTCTVLRDGIFIGSTVMKETSHKQLIQMMFGDVEIKSRPSDLVIGDKIVLEVKELTQADSFYNISFKLKENEILGIAGMLGSGRTELLKGIFGAERADSGEVIVDGKIMNNPNPVKMKEAGLAFISEDRKNEGLIHMLSIHSNLCVASLDEIANGVFITEKDELPFVKTQVHDLQIKVASTDLPVSSLSGGNQQKVVIGNWLNTSPKIILLDEPSRGIDINAKQQIFDIIWQQSREGVASILVSSEMEELLEVCNRILVIREGRIIGDINPDDYNVEELYTLCLGGKTK